MSVSHEDWLVAATKRAQRTVDADPLIIDAVERAEMDREYATLDDPLR
jgi:hypothetical protein